MPGPIVPALIAGGASLIGGGINAASQGSMNRANRKWSEKMYQMQRRDSLADWTMQNDYNHPSAVMQRLREADLNPHLVYGNGANMPTAQIKPGNVPGASTEAPQIDLGGAASKGLAAYFQTQIQEATINNLRAQNTLLEKEAALKEAQEHNVEAQTSSVEYDISRKNFDLDFSMDTRSTSMEQLQANLEKTKADVFIGLSRDQREWILTANSVTESMVRMANIRAQTAKTYAERAKAYADIENIKKDTQLKQLDIDLKKKGIQPGDPAWMRIIGRAYDNLINGRGIGNNPITDDLPGHENDGIIPMPWPRK